jgi:hypothetical protein
LDEKVRALASVAGVAARAGDLDRAGALAAVAEQVARSIMSPDEQAWALAYVAGAAAQAGDLGRAEQVARSIASPDGQAEAMASIAGVAEPTRARAFIAGALAAGRWTIPLNELADIDPTALSAFADELAGLRSVPDQPDNGPLSSAPAPGGPDRAAGPARQGLRDSRTLSGTSPATRRRRTPPITIGNR